MALQLTKGSIILLAHRLTSRIVNRLRPPTSHDIIVPSGTVSLFGTTSEHVEDPGTTRVRPEEIQALLEGAAPLIPGIRNFRALRAWAGVRPLVRPAAWPEGMPLPRRHKVIDHGGEGAAAFFTVCGGSLTTHRSMAEDVGDQLCRFLGWNRPSVSATTPLLATGRAFWRPVAGYAQADAAAGFGGLLCECESVPASAVRAAAATGPTLEELRRRLRIGFGPCQGTFCAPRAAGLLAAADPARERHAELRDFWLERLKGMAPTGWGPQARQILLSDHLFQRTLGLHAAVDPPAGDRR